MVMGRSWCPLDRGASLTREPWRSSGLSPGNSAPPVHAGPSWRLPPPARSGGETRV